MRKLYENCYAMLFTMQCTKDEEENVEKLLTEILMLWKIYAVTFFFAFYVAILLLVIERNYFKYLNSLSLKES